MKVAWTKEQQKVIDLRERNILVSAAAGSGKTAVLVERIIAMITQGETPIDIDKLLIVTFTNAAASQMRERVSEAIEQRLEENPLDIHLQKQATLVHNAYITTIHSFCLRVIRNHFNRIDLDPAFRIGDEGELKLLKADVMEGILEKHYEEKNEAFFHFVESYSTGKTDKELEEMIQNLYQFAMSYPWPMEWLNECIQGYQIETMEELEQSKWYQSITDNIGITIAEIIQQIEQLIELSLKADGPYMYEPTLAQEKEMLEGVLKELSYEKYYEKFNTISFGRLSSKKDENVTAELREIVKKQRDGIKKSVIALKERYFYATPQEILLDIQKCKQSVEVLVHLTMEFIEAYKAAKAEKNLVDYNDLEHFALSILVEKVGEEIKPSEAAREYEEIFEEIMIDEYQDSNLVQEMILKAVSRESIKNNNIFMVGDVKQSIYKFRLARPELFMEKYNTYSLEESSVQRIDLDKNFRSRGEVLQATNFIFHQIMRESIGGIDYNKECALYLGGSYPAPIKERDYETEVIVIDLDSQLEEEGTKKSAKKEKEYTAKEWEAKAIAKRIKELVNEKNGCQIIDKNTKAYRSVRYSDIVILLRTMSGWAETFQSVLMSEGIPAHTGSQTGYFSTIEVTTLLNLLRIIDNPLQDIPFTAVLTSPIVSFSGEELAMIKSTYKEKSIYVGSRQYALEGEDTNLKNKLLKFFQRMERFRKVAVYTPIHTLIWQILEETNYGRFVAAMPGGEQRKANIDMLIEKAIVFESTSYKGLFHFVRYIENLQKYDVDFGEADIINENDDTVRILSIHKSKGLEFPVVFVSGMGKSFNNQDARAKLIMHPDLGVGADYIDYEQRVKAPTLIKKAMQKQIQMENLAEELRVLYVALTRAKEKLIMTGAIAKLESKINSFAQIVNQEEKLGYRVINEASNYMEWVLQAIIRHQDSKEFLEEYETSTDYDSLPFSEEAKFGIYKVGLSDLVKDEILTQILHEDVKQELQTGLEGRQENESYVKMLEGKLNFTYEHEELEHIHTKMTVSEIKKIGQAMDDVDTSLNLVEEEIPVPLIPRFIDSEAQVVGADRGIAYHKVLQLIDFNRVGERKEIEKQLEEMVLANKLTKEAKESVSAFLLEKFVMSDIGQRMKKAQEKGKLYRERSFVMGLEAREVIPSSKSDEMVLIQGMIDAFFEEDEQIILVDYKTDYVKSEHDFISKYRIQLQYYTEALKKITGKNVKERVIYSLMLGRSIVVD